MISVPLRDEVHVVARGILEGTGWRTPRDFRSPRLCTKDTLAPDSLALSERHIRVDYQFQAEEQALDYKGPALQPF